VAFRTLDQSWGAAAALSLFFVSAAPVGAQTRPLLTEEATTGPAGRVVFETGFEAIADEPNYLTGIERTQWEGPLLRLVYSAADNVDFGLDWAGRIGTTSVPGERAVSAWGDVTLRAKLRILKGEGRRPTLGARFGVIFPNTPFNDKQFNPLGLGPNTFRAFVEGLITQPVGPLRLDGNAGLFVHEEALRPHEQRDFLSYGLALKWPVRPGWEMVAELAGRAGIPEPGAPRQSEVRVGLRLGRGRVRADAALRRGLVAVEGTWGGTVGLTWTMRPGR
jgi:hypothetical protein